MLSRNFCLNTFSTTSPWPSGASQSEQDSMGTGGRAHRSDESLPFGRRKSKKKSSDETLRVTGEDETLRSTSKPPAGSDMPAARSAHPEGIADLPAESERGKIGGLW